MFNYYFSHCAVRCESPDKQQQPQRNTCLATNNFRFYNFFCFVNLLFLLYVCMLLYTISFLMSLWQSAQLIQNTNFYFVAFGSTYIFHRPKYGKQAKISIYCQIVNPEYLLLHTFFCIRDFSHFPTRRTQSSTCFFMNFVRSTLSYANFPQPHCKNSFLLHFLQLNTASPVF